MSNKKNVPGPHKTGYRPEIDGLRAIAVLSVILYHAGEPYSKLLRGGFLGVDVFFVLSGFLITGIIAREAARGGFSIFDFYERRARRILPALIVVVLASIPAAWYLFTPDQMKGFSQSLIALTTFSSNIFFWLTSGYFAPGAELQPMIHTWSLAVEEQYYIIFPPLLMLFYRRSKVFVGMAILLLLSLIAAEIMTRNWPSASFYLLPSRAWQLLAGALGGYAMYAYGSPDGNSGPFIWRVLGRFRTGLSWLAFATLGACLIVFHAWLPLPGFLSVIPIAATVILLTCVQPGHGVYWILTRRPLVGIGLISYSAYLWHQPLFVFFRHGTLDRPSALQMAVLTGIVLALAWFSWRFIEQPFRSKQFSLGRICLILGGGMTAIFAFGVVGQLSSGFPSQRYSPEAENIFRTAAPSPMRRACHSRAPESACVYPEGNPAAWAVLGDSHGVEIAYALSTIAGQHGEGVLHLTRSGCPPALAFETDVRGCHDWIEKSVQNLENYDHPLTVLLTYRHAAYFFGQNEAIYPDLPDTTYRISSGTGIAEKREIYLASFAEIVRRLLAAGHKVDIMLPLPEIARSVDKLTVHYLLSGKPAEASSSIQVPSVPRAYYDGRTENLNRVFLEMFAGWEGVSIIDPANTFCDTTSCFAVRDGVALYFDDDHPSVLAATSVLRGNKFK